jgi:hypothetical protein
MSSPASAATAAPGTAGSVWLEDAPEPDAAHKYTGEHVDGWDAVMQLVAITLGCRGQRRSGSPNVGARGIADSRPAGDLPCAERAGL